MGRADRMLAPADGRPKDQVGVARDQLEDLDEGDAEKALEVAQGINLSLPNDPNAFFAIARAERRLGHLDEAEAAAKRSTELSSESADLVAIQAGLCLDRLW